MLMLMLLLMLMPRVFRARHAITLSALLLLRHARLVVAMNITSAPPCPRCAIAVSRVIDMMLLDDAPHAATLHALTIFFHGGIG